MTAEGKSKTRVYHRPDDSGFAVTLVGCIVDTLDANAVTLTILNPKIFPNHFDETVWDAVLSAAGYEDTTLPPEPREFRGEEIRFARAIFLLGVLFFSDMEIRGDRSDLTITTSHDEWIEITSSDPEAFASMEALFTTLNLVPWKV